MEPIASAPPATQVEQTPEDLLDLHAVCAEIHQHMDVTVDRIHQWALTEA